MQKSFFKSVLGLKSIITVLAIILICQNAFYLFVKIKAEAMKRPLMYEPGYQFVSFKPILNDVKRIGYLTDKNMSREKNDGFFLQAQYFLAPTIIGLNKPQFKYNIIDFTGSGHVDHPQINEALKILRSLPVAQSNYGQALVTRVN